MKEILNRHNSYSESITTGLPQHSFGMLMQERSYSSAAYKYGFNGKEKDNEINVDGGDYDFGARIYDGRLGRWLSIDPERVKYSYESNFAFCSNKPIAFKDIDGMDKWRCNIILDENGKEVAWDTYKESEELKSVRKRVMGRDWMGAEEDEISYDWYDFVEIHVYRIQADGTLTEDPVKVDNIKFRTNTSVENEYWARICEGLDNPTGGEEWASQNGHDEETRKGNGKNKRDNIDALLDAIKISKSASNSQGQTWTDLTKQISNLKDLMNKIKAVKNTIEIPKKVIENIDKSKEELNKDKSVKTIPSTPVVIKSRVKCYIDTIEMKSKCESEKFPSNENKKDTVIYGSIPK